MSWDRRLNAEEAAVRPVTGLRLAEHHHVSNGPFKNTHNVWTILRIVGERSLNIIGYRVVSMMVLCFCSGNLDSDALLGRLPPLYKESPYPVRLASVIPPSRVSIGPCSCNIWFLYIFSAERLHELMYRAPPFADSSSDSTMSILWYR